MINILIIKNGTCNVDNTIRNILLNNIYQQKIYINTLCSCNSKDIENIKYSDYNAIIICGGNQSLVGRLDNDYKYKYLNILIDLVKIWIDNNVNILGICLGAQIIGEACGYMTKHLNKPIIGYEQSIYLVETIDNFNNSNNNNFFDTSFKNIMNYYMSCHYDYIDIFPEAKNNDILSEVDNINIMAVLDTTDFDIPYAFKIKNALCVQFHPEIDTLMMAEIINLYSSNIDNDVNKLQLIKANNYMSNNYTHISNATNIFFAKWLSSLNKVK